MQRLGCSVAACAAAIAIACGAAEAAPAKPPCSALVTEATLERAFGLAKLHLYREAELPSLTRAEGTVVFTCAFELFDGRYKPGKGAFVEIESVQVKSLPVAHPQVLEVRNLLAKSGSGLYPIPTYGAERAGGYAVANSKTPLVIAGWWSIALGRRVSLQAQWPHHTKALRGVLDRIGARIVRRDVLRSPVS
jgi:hypothetical protein